MIHQRGSVGILCLLVSWLLCSTAANGAYYCSYGGPDSSVHKLELTDFYLDGDPDMTVGDQVTIGFKLKNVSDGSLQLGPQGIFAQAVKPDGTWEQFDNLYANAYLKQGEDVEFPATKITLDKFGTWTFWAGYQVDDGTGMVYGPDYWHSCSITVQDPVVNKPPNATILYPPSDTEIMVGEAVVFSGTGEDPDGDLPLAFSWRFSSGSGVAPQQGQTTEPLVFDRPGIYQAILSVTDARGGTDPTPDAIKVRVLLPPLPDSKKQTDSIQALAKESAKPLTYRFINGLPRFVSMQLPVPQEVADDPVVRAMWYLRRYRDLYLLYNPEDQLYLSRIRTDAGGAQHLFFRQRYRDIPVFASGLTVHLDGDVITSTDGNYLPEIEWFVPPQLTARDAQAVALSFNGGTELEVIGGPQLLYFNRSLFGHSKDDTTHLCWRVNIVGKKIDEGDYRQWSCFIDAISGTLLLAIDETRTGDRPGEDFEIRDVDHESSKACFGWYQFWHANDLWFDEDGDTGDYPGAASDLYLDGAEAAAFSHDTYHFYYEDFARRSWDNDDARLDARVHVENNWRNAGYMPGCDQVRFGDGYVTNDVFAHEFTHGVTTHSADLIYQDESGALNESFSDVFAAYLDRDDWLMGEDVAVFREDAGAGGTVGGSVGDGDRESGDECGNGVDDDGDGVIDEGCPETGDACNNIVDDDGDGYINEGCPETGSQCGNGVDDDFDTYIDEGCLETCQDGIDNGLDGVADSDDNNCYFRNMADPTDKNHPDRMADWWNDPDNDDNGGVHTNSGVLNKVFHLLVEGGEHYGIEIGTISGPPGWDRSGRLFYDTLTARLRSGSQMIDARDTMVELASEYRRRGDYGFMAWNVCDVIRAFHSVGLGENDYDCDGSDDLADNDDDNDRVIDSEDNCPLTYNPGQWDFDGDGFGNECDDDDDNDGVDNDEDNCPYVANASQRDTDGDGRGNACDDGDLDGVIDDDDICPDDPDPVSDWYDHLGGYHHREQPDYDLDGIGDACDLDSDGDGVGDDGDGSGVAGDNPCRGNNSDSCDDNCPFTANSSQSDVDWDAVGNSCDNCQLVANADQQDQDGDGTGNSCDGDIDGDGVANEEDNCPYLPNPSQATYGGQPVGCSSLGEIAHLMHGPGALYFSFGSYLDDLSIPISFDPCRDGNCPDYLTENFTAEFTFDAGADVAARIIDDRGFMVAGSDFGEGGNMQFRVAADHYYLGPDMEAVPTIMDAQIDGAAALDQAPDNRRPFSETRYYLVLTPPPDAQAGTQLTLQYDYASRNEKILEPNLADVISGLQILSGKSPAYADIVGYDVDGDEQFGFAEIIYIMNSFAEKK